jgi:hypothetical protein
MTYISWFCQLCNFLFTTCFVLPAVHLLAYSMFYFANRVTSWLQHVCFVNCVTSCLQHAFFVYRVASCLPDVLFCQPCNILFKICLALAIVQFIVYSMIYFANCVTSCLQHVLFCQACNFLLTTSFILPTV